MPDKKCPKCSETKDFSLFYQNSRSKTNTSPYCKACSNLRTTSYARNNKEKIPSTGYSLKRRYGITTEEYEALLKEQDYKCKICSADKCRTGRNFSVDHSHSTGRIRGLLCASCNIGLGQFKDSCDLLTKAINYLENNN